MVGRRDWMTMRCRMIHLGRRNSGNIRPMWPMNDLLLHRRLVSDIWMRRRHPVRMRRLIHHNVRVLPIRTNDKLCG